MAMTVINSEPLLHKFIGELRSTWNQHRYVRVSLKTGKDRSLDQNAIAHVWYEQIAKELREDDEHGVKRFCKLHFGVPILRAADADFREMYDNSIKPHLSYEQKLKAMDYLPVTSLMTVPQASAYLVEVQTHYRGRGVQLEFPEDHKEAKAA